MLRAVRATPRPARAVGAVVTASSVLPDVIAALAATGLPARRLELEVTEPATLEDAASGLSVLRTLRDKGVRVAMHDFGTGYSSLRHLRSFPSTT